MSIHGSSESGLLLHGLKHFFVFLQLCKFNSGLASVLELLSVENLEIFYTPWLSSYETILLLDYANW